MLKGVGCLNQDFRDTRILTISESCGLSRWQSRETRLLSE